MASSRSATASPSTAEPSPTSLRETFVPPVQAQGRLVKQSGGHGQYAVCSLEIEPLERGAGFRVRRQGRGRRRAAAVHPLGREGRPQPAREGRPRRLPVVDVRVTLVDGKAHSVDSSDIAFQTAPRRPSGGRQRVDGGAARADRRGGDHRRRRLPRRGDGRPARPSWPGGRHRAARRRGWTVVHAEVPQPELSRYPIDLRSVSHGTGSFAREPIRHDLPAAGQGEELLKT